MSNASSIMSKSPKNATEFQRLLRFGRRILEICDELKITPITYGSLAYFCHTNDHTMPVHDIDFLVPEDAFSMLMESLERENIPHELKSWPSIVCDLDGSVIELDSMEQYLFPRSSAYEAMRIDGVEFHILNRGSLADIYQEAIDGMPEKIESYKTKLLTLRESCCVHEE